MNIDVIKKYGKEIFLLAFPVCLGQLSHILTNVADTIMLGKYNPTHLAASSFGFNVFIPILVFAIGLSMGITPLVASTKKKDKKQLQSLFKHNFYLYGSVSFLLAIITFFFSPYLSLLNQPEEVNLLAQPYFQLLSISLIPIMFYQIGKQYIEGLGQTKQAMYISIVGNGLNVIGNGILIYGVPSLNIPEMGLIGAGYATLFARIFMAIAMLALLKIEFKEYFFIEIKNFEKVILKKINEIGFPISLQMLLEVGAFAFTAIMVGWIDEKEGSTNNLAAHQIAISLASISYIIATGIGSAMTIKIGQANNNIKLIKIIGNIGLLMSLLWMTVTMLIFWIGKDLLPLLYLKNEEVIIISLTSKLLIIAGIFQLPDGIQAICSGILRGMNDVKKPTLISIISYWILAIPLSYISAFWLKWGVYGIWLGLVIGLLCTAILLYSRFKYKTQKLSL